jgi:hypothetical protein
VSAQFLAVPISVAWVSERLYREKPSDFPFGRAVEVDGWDEALDAAWADLVERPGVEEWARDYVALTGTTEMAIVSFRDVTRVAGRHGRGYFGVSYPADLLLAAENRPVAMQTAILDVLDRHVTRSNLDLPLLSSLVARE